MDVERSLGLAGKREAGREADAVILPRRRWRTTRRSRVIEVAHIMRLLTHDCNVVPDNGGQMNGLCDCQQTREYQDSLADSIRSNDYAKQFSAGNERPRYRRVTTKSENSCDNAQFEKELLSGIGRCRLTNVTPSIEATAN